MRTRQTRRWATTSVWRRFLAGLSLDEIARTAYAPRHRPHEPAWLETVAGQRARHEVEDIIRRWMRRVDGRRA